MSSATSSEPDDLPLEFRGVFAYLDVTLPESLRACAVDPSHSLAGRPRACGWNEVRRKIAEIINHTFRLQYWGCALHEVLDRYRIYNRDDRADALAVAYCLHKRGEPALKAFEADYAVWWGGIYTWVDVGELQQAAREGKCPRVWEQFRGLYRKGDRVLKYTQPTSIGHMLVRGDRLVWEEESLHMCVPFGNPRWEADFAEFERLGGAEAFLAGKFTWPPPGWVNPLTQADVDAEIRRRRGTDEIDPTSPAAMSFRDPAPGEIGNRDQQLLAEVGDLLGIELKPQVLQ